MSVEFCWRVHSAQEAWSAKADAKASMLLAFQGGGFIVAATSRETIAPAIDGVPAFIAASGVVMIIAAMLLAAAAIAPSLGSTRRNHADHRHGWIYFGHVRRWDSAELAARLCGLSEHDQVRALSAQLVMMSRITWRKHRFLQGSVVLTLATMLVTVVAVALQVWT